MTPRTSERADPANQAEETSVERRFPSEPQAAASARRAPDLIGQHLSRTALENTKLLVSELVTNAVRHGPDRSGAEVRVRATVRPDAVRVEVTDEGLGFVQPPASGLLAVGGWGLVLVDRVADRWGIEDGAPTQVWFELDRSSAPDGPAIQPTELDTLQIALDAGRMGTWHWDMPAGTVRWSESLERIHGFTDGLFDPRHPTALGEAGLRSLVVAGAGLTAQETVDRVGEAVADPGGQAPDDVCILVLRVAP